MDSAIFKQNETFLLGSEAAIKNLATADSATIAVVSDSHGNIVDLLNVIKNCDNCSALIFCGDGVADLVGALNSLASTEIVKSLPPVIAFARGNNDMPMCAMKNPETSGLINIQVPLTQELCVAGHKLMVTHGHKYVIYSGLQQICEVAKSSGADVVLYGHTHIASVSNRDGILLVNPGSISLPRGGQPKCFAKMYLEKGRAPSDYVFFEQKGTEQTVFKNPCLS